MVILRRDKRRQQRQKEKESGIPGLPPNRFILYRNAKLEEERKRNENYNVTMHEFSTIASKAWQQESYEVKRHYAKIAAELKAEHRKRYPNYVHKAQNKRTPKAMAYKPQNTEDNILNNNIIQGGEDSIFTFGEGLVPTTNDSPNHDWNFGPHSSDMEFLCNSLAMGSITPKIMSLQSQNTEDKILDNSMIQRGEGAIIEFGEGLVPQTNGSLHQNLNFGPYKSEADCLCDSFTMNAITPNETAQTLYQPNDHFSPEWAAECPDLLFPDIFFANFNENMDLFIINQQYTPDLNFAILDNKNIN